MAVTFPVSTVPWRDLGVTSFVFVFHFCPPCIPKQWLRKAEVWGPSPADGSSYGLKGMGMMAHTGKLKTKCKQPMGDKHRQKHSRPSKPELERSKHDKLSASVIAALDGSEQDIHHPSELLDDLLEGEARKGERLNKKLYEAELERLQTDLVKMQYLSLIHI